MIIDVHFTTIPTRYAYLEYTINSWLSQTVPVRHIIISICQEYKHYKENDLSLLNQYKELSDKIIIQVLNIDHGPHDKVVGALHYRDIEKKEKKEKIYTIICDDDLYYHPETVASYQEMILGQKSPTVYTHFRDETHRLKNIRHIQGADSYILPPFFFKKTTTEIYTTFLDKCLQECPDAFYQDDYVISYYIAKVCGIDIKGVSRPMSYQLVHLIDELHQNPLVHEREKNTINYFDSK
jgi:hypothetical protein